MQWYAEEFGHGAWICQKMPFSPCDVDPDHDPSAHLHTILGKDSWNLDKEFWVDKSLLMHPHTHTLTDLIYIICLFGKLIVVYLICLLLWMDLLKLEQWSVTKFLTKVGNDQRTIYDRMCVMYGEHMPSYYQVEVWSKQGGRNLVEDDQKSPRAVDDKLTMVHNSRQIRYNKRHGTHYQILGKLQLCT